MPHNCYPSQMFKTTSLDEAIRVLSYHRQDQHLDIVEICGGEARTSQIALRTFGMSVGPNFDIVANYDLHDRTTLRKVCSFLFHRDVLCYVMAPMSTPHLNWAMVPEGKQQQYQTA